MIPSRLDDPAQKVGFIDNEGGQRTVTRFGPTPTQEGTRISSGGRHWQIDGPSPRWAPLHWRRWPSPH